MGWKRIVVLANSFKHGGRCIAGRELLPRGGRYQPGPWVRPVAGRETRMLTPEDVKLPGGEPRVGEVIDVPVSERARDPCQPDNWELDPKQPWSRPEGVAPPPVPWCEEHPKNLWLERGNSVDRVSHESLTTRPPRQSLYLIRPERFRLHLTRDPKTAAQQVRAKFAYNRTEYALRVTDPTLLAFYRDRAGGVGSGATEFPLPCGDRLLVCVSLAMNFHGQHYKVVATVLEETAMEEPLPRVETLYTVGHSNHEPDAFLQLLRRHRVTAVADVRSHPYSAYNPHYNRETLQAYLENNQIRYVFLGLELGARRTERDCYEGGKAKYPLIAQSELFRQGLDRLRRGLERYRIALMCAEKDPLTCHRMILVARHIKAMGVRVEHILDDGRLESQDDAEGRLLAEADLRHPELFRSAAERIEEAYERRARQIEYEEEEDPGLS